MERKIKKMYDYLYYKPLIHKFLADVRDKYKDNLVSVIVFGSIARGKGRKESDIELKIRGSQVFERYIKEGLMPCFSYLIFSIKETEENHYIFLDMIEDSLILYDKKNYFKKKLSLLKNRLSFLGSKKISLDDGTWYWDLKPDIKMGEEFVL
jgi:hypothetical protein